VHGKGRVFGRTLRAVLVLRSQPLGKFMGGSVFDQSLERDQSWSADSVIVVAVLAGSCLAGTERRARYACGPGGPRIASTRST
jgi:hypothetical protein